MATVIVDTSVWIKYFRDPDSAVGDEVERLLGTGEVVLSGVVYAELLRGARHEQELRSLMYKLQVLPFLEVGKETWRSTGELLFRLRRQGITLPLPDAIIASAALDGGHEVYTLDEHFRQVPGLRLHEPAVSGNDRG